MNNPRGRGRPHASNVANRRLEAEQYLATHFPRSAQLWAELRGNQLSPEKLADTIVQMIAEAKSAVSPETVVGNDQLKLNPEQAVARVLQRVGMREKAIAACQAELSALDMVRSAIRQILIAHQVAGKSDIAEITAAAAQRPTVDREVERRILDILRTGVSRAGVIRRKQNADKLWSMPWNWASLPGTVGRFIIMDQPPGGGIDRELLPPSANILHYLSDASAFQAQWSGATAAQFIKAAEEELTDWIRLHYPGPTVRQPAVMAAAWASLILIKDPAMEQSDRRIDVLMPSAWKPGRVMRIKSS